jgi:hypothetical protein
MWQLGQVLRPEFDLAAAVKQTTERGYLFATDALQAEARQALAFEINNTELAASDERAQAVNAGRPNEVQQHHERAYFAYGDERIPAANFVVNSLVQQIRAIRDHPELRSWQPTEVGYQRYRGSRDWIGPHRDRASDQLLSVTFTLSGSGMVRIFEAVGDNPNDYSQLSQTDEFRTLPGSLMLLRAPGLGNGEQVIHQVLPPAAGRRLIVNLRMRPDVLPPPVTAAGSE